jgi:hypothetical protein
MQWRVRVTRTRIANHRKRANNLQTRETGKARLGHSSDFVPIDLGGVVDFASLAPPSWTSGRGQPRQRMGVVYARRRPFDVTPTQANQRLSDCGPDAGQHHVRSDEADGFDGLDQVLGGSRVDGRNARNIEDRDGRGGLNAGETPSTALRTGQRYKEPQVPAAQEPCRGYPVRGEF